MNSTEMDSTDMKNEARDIKAKCREYKNCYGCPFCRERQCILVQDFPCNWKIDGEEEDE